MTPICCGIRTQPYSHVRPPDLPALAFVLRVALLVVVVVALLHLLVTAVTHARIAAAAAAVATL